VLFLCRILHVHRVIKSSHGEWYSAPLFSCVWLTVDFKSAILFYLLVPYVWCYNRYLTYLNGLSKSGINPGPFFSLRHSDHFKKVKDIKFKFCSFWLTSSWITICLATFPPCNWLFCILPTILICLFVCLCACMFVHMHKYMWWFSVLLFTQCDFWWAKMSASFWE
jgi:hypothetical protein